MRKTIYKYRKRDGSGGKRTFQAVLFVFLILLTVLWLPGPGTTFASAAQGTAPGQVNESDQKGAPGQSDVPDAGSTAITIKVTYGFDDTAKGDRYLPVRISLDNKTEKDFTGTLEILTTESSMEVYRYDYPVTLSATGGFHEMYYIPLGVKNDQIFVTLKDAAGSQILKKRVKLNVSSDVSEVFVGNLSNTPGELSFLDGVGIRYGSMRTNLVELNKTNVPEDSKGFDQLDLIMVTDYNMDELSDKQKSALMDWVENGGTLLFGGGSGYRENLGSFAAEFLIPPYAEPSLKPVNLGAEYSQNAPQDAVMDLICVDMTLKNGSTLMAGDGFSLMSFSHRKKGRIVVTAFALQDIGEFCETHPSFMEKFLTMTFGETKANELSQMDYYGGFSRLYFAVQGLINTGNVDRLPKVAWYTIVMVVYILLIGPGLYLYLKKKSLQRLYLGGVAICALLFTAAIYIMGMKTRFRAPFFTYATILDASQKKAEEETFINVRSPFNKPYTVELDPSYTVRPITKSFYYDGNSIPDFTGEEGYKTAVVQNGNGTELRVRDTAAFTPKMFTLRKQIRNVDNMGIGGSVSVFDGKVSGTVVNHFDYKLENATLLLYGRAVLLGDMEPGQEVVLEGREVLSYPLNYTYVFAQTVTGADKYEKADISNVAYMLAQERTRLLSFYMDENMDEYTPEARIVAFSPIRNEREFLMDGDFITEGITLVTSSLEVMRQENGMIYRSALEQEPNVIAGNYQVKYNSMYSGEPSEPAVIEYSLGSDLDLIKLTFDHLSPIFIGNPKYPYLSAFQGKIYFYNYDTGRNDLVEDKKTEFSRSELDQYLSPSNTITIKYVSEGSNEYGWDRLLPMLYTIGREK